MTIPNSTVPTDEERKHERALRAPDPRALDERYQPRIRLYEDDAPSLTELGTEQDAFIDPDNE